MRRFLSVGMVIVLGVAGQPGEAAGQVRSDTVVALPAVIATADRGPWPLAGSVSAVARITASELRAFPNATVADALRHVPGLTIVDFRGDGVAPQPIVRGFYGGGEAEYMVVLLNGNPLNDVQAGLVRWDAMPLAAVESIEIVRGGNSALYGDAALGGVVNVITRRPGPDSPPRLSLAGGSDETVRGSAHFGTRLLGHDVGIFWGIDRSGGFRAHGERTIGSAGLDYAVLTGSEGHLTISGLAHWRDLQEPGALLASALEEDRTASDAIHRFDRSEEATQRLSLDGRRTFGPGIVLTGLLSGENRDAELVRTIALAPGFADTKERDLGTRLFTGSLQLALEDGLLPHDRLTFGVDGSYGSVESAYYQILTGARPEYESATGERGDLDASGDGRRLAGAVFAQYIVLPTQAIRLSAGIRADWFEDEFDPDGGAALDPSHSAVSPKAGINVRWLDAGRHLGTIYATVSRSFKAPTLDQLFDQRSVPVAPGVSLTTSNPLLEPQHGTNLEAGLYHTVDLGEGLQGDLSLAAYQMDMENELDFDIATLRYVNLGESRHRGLEAAARLTGPRAYGFLNYTLQNATEETGDNAGRYLRAIPRQVVAGGVGVSPTPMLDLGVSVNHSRDIYLDDANTIEHSPFTRVDGRVALSLPDEWAGLGLFLDVRNLLDSEFSTTGFPDPSGSGAVYYYPAAGRTLELGITIQNRGR